MRGTGNMILLTATSANAVMALTDNTAGTQNKLDLRVASAGDTERFNFVGAEIHVANGLTVTMTNATATIILKKAGG